MKTKLKLGIQIALASVIALLFIVLIFLEPDAGTSVVLGGIWFLTIFSVLPNQTFNAAILLIIAAVGVATEAILFKNVTLGIITGGIAIAVTGGTFLISKKMRVLPFIAIIAGIMFGLGGFYVWNNVFHDYQRERIETFINPSGKSLDEAFQVEQSKVAIGSGMIFGKGFGLGTQSKLRFVPEHQTDFIFASFAEEFGLIGSTFLLFLYGVLITRIFRAAVVVENRFGSIICLAVGIKILIEVFINIGMNVGVVPATGVPLPLMSAGGSLLLVTMIGLGLVQSTLIHREE